MPKKVVTPRLAWALTGSGHFFTESLEMMGRIAEIDVFVSRAAIEVVRMYKKDMDKLPRSVRIFSDNLATNVFAQAGKCRVPTIVFACDTAPELETEAPSGMVKVYPRRIDLENAERLKTFESVEVVESMADLDAALRARFACLNISYS